jgi:hypothetical protein
MSGRRPSRRPRSRASGSWQSGWGGRS